MNKSISDMIDRIDDKYISEAYSTDSAGSWSDSIFAEETPQEKRRTHRIKWNVVAACVALVFAFGAAAVCGVLAIPSTDAILEEVLAVPGITDRESCDLTSNEAFQEFMKRNDWLPTLAKKAETIAVYYDENYDWGEVKEGEGDLSVFNGTLAYVIDGDLKDSIVTILHQDEVYDALYNSGIIISTQYPALGSIVWDEMLFYPLLKAARYVPQSVMEGPTAVLLDWLEKNEFQFYAASSVPVQDAAPQDLAHYSRGYEELFSRTDKLEALERLASNPIQVPNKEWMGEEASIYYVFCLLWEKEVIADIKAEPDFQTKYPTLAKLIGKSKALQAWIESGELIGHEADYGITWDLQ